MIVLVSIFNLMIKMKFYFNLILMFFKCTRLLVLGYDFIWKY